MSAVSPLICSVYSPKRGSGQALSSVVSPAVFSSATRSSSFPMRPEAWSPSATAQAPGLMGNDEDLVAPGVREGVSEDQTPLRVGRNYLYRLAGVHLKYVARLEGVPARQILCRRHEGDDVEREIQGPCGLHGPEDGRATAHVELHVLHSGRWLYGDTTRVECDGLAYEHDGRGVASPAMLERDEVWLVGGGAADGSQTREPLLLDAGPVEDG